MSNLNRFSKFLHCGERMKKSAAKAIRHYPPHLRHVAVLPWEIKNSIFCRYSADVWKNMHRTRQRVPIPWYFTMGCHCPLKIVPCCMRRSGPVTHGFLGLSLHTKRHLDRFSGFAGLKTTTDKEIDKPCYSACNNRPRVRSTAMQADIFSPINVF